MTFDINTLLKKHFISTLTKRVCGDNYEIIERPMAFMICKRDECERDVHRLILLPPKGYTANAPNQVNSHDEAEYATIQIKGAVRRGKQGFSKVKDCLLVASFHENGSVSDLNEPYLTFDIDGNDPDLVTKLHSAGKVPFPVVKSNGVGFYHNLINTTDDWLVLVLHKRLRPQKPVDLEFHLTTLQNEQADVLRQLYGGIVEHGDAVFSESPGIVDAVTKLPPAISLPALGEMLYVHDTGKHEACTAFAIILKIGKANPQVVTEFLQENMVLKNIPAYYTQQLIEKINHKPDNSNKHCWHGISS